MGKHILLLGIGQTGCDISETFLHRMSDEDIKVHAFAVDTDARTFANVALSQGVPMVNNENLLATVERLGAERVAEFFPCDWLADGTDFARGLLMNTGANLWRMKAYLSFIAFFEDKEAAEPFHAALREVASELTDDDELELYTAASLVGGTGSALFLPLTLYVKKFLKDAGARVTYSAAMLLNPDIYAGQLTAEQRVKAYANAYAAQSELNAVNISLLSEDCKDRPRVEFKLGAENFECGILFDSEKKNKEAPPFDKVVLFSRTTGVNTVGAHVGIAADILVSMATSGVTLAEQTIDNNMAIYEGISLTRVRYSPDSISEYIAARQTEKIIGGEFAAIHKTAKTLSRSAAADARAFAFRGDVDATEQYCNAFISYARNAMENKGGERAFIGRETRASLTDDVGIDEWREDYYDTARQDYLKLIESMDAGIETDESRAISEYVALVEKQSRKSKDNINNRKKKEKPIPKKERRARLLENAENAWFNLSAFCESCRISLTEGRDAFESSLVSEGTDGYSFIDDVMLRDGSTPHPSLALLRLCLLYTHLKEHLRTRPIIPTADFLGAESVPDLLLFVDEDAATSLYSRAGRRRFMSLAVNDIEEVNIYLKRTADEDEEKKLYKDRTVIEIAYAGIFKKKFFVKDGHRLFNFNTDGELKQRLADDEELFVADLKAVHERICIMAKYIRCEQAIAVLGKLIDKYRALGDSAVAIHDDLASDARLAAVYASTDNGVIINVATSKEEKEGVLAEYLTTYSPELVRSDDLELTRRFIQAIAGDSDACRVDEIVDFVNKSYKNRFVNSDFYKENIDKNVICALLDSMRGRFAPPSISYDRVFGERFSPIRVMRADFESSDVELIRSTRAIFSVGVWNYVADNPDIFDGMEPKDFFEARLYDAGEYRGAAIFSDYVDDREILIRREISGIPAYLIEEYNENSTDPAARRAYDAAKAAARAHSTAMWNPDAVYNRGSARPLPLISPAAEREYELSSARALLYATLSGGVYTSTLEDVGEVYFTYSAGAKEPILLGTEPVAAKDVKSLAEWVYSSPEWVAQNSARYAAMLHGRQAVYGDVSAYKRHAASLARSSAVASLAEAFSTLIIKFYSSKALDFCGYALSVATAVYDTVKLQSIGEASLAEEGIAFVYNALCDVFMQRLIKDAKGDRARNIVDWINSQGLFKRLVPPMDFYSYET